MSITDLMRECVARDMSADETVAEFKRRFPASTIKSLGGRRRIREMHSAATLPRPAKGCIGPDTPLS